MLRKIAALLSLVVLAVVTASPVFAEDTSKATRVEGRVVRHNKDKSTLTVHVRDNALEKTVQYDPSTVWTSQYHGAKKSDPIDASQVKDGDQVICLGTYDAKGVFHATEVSKRLSHSPK